MATVTIDMLAKAVGTADERVLRAVVRLNVAAQNGRAVARAARLESDVIVRHTAWLQHTRWTHSNRFKLI